MSIHPDVYFTGPGIDSTESNAALAQVLQAYPDDPSLGSPYQPAGVSPSSRFFGPTNQYKVSLAKPRKKSLVTNVGSSSELPLFMLISDTNQIAASGSLH